MKTALKMIPAPDDWREVPPCVTRETLDQIRALAKGHTQEADIVKWTWESIPARDVALPLLRELQEEARKKLAPKPLEVARKAYAQSTEKVIELEKDNAQEHWERSTLHNAKVFERMRRELNGPEAWSRAQEMARIESMCFLREQEKLLRQARQDICGLWGPPTLASPLD